MHHQLRFVISSILFIWCLNIHSAKNLVAAAAAALKILTLSVHTQNSDRW